MGLEYLSSSSNIFYLSSTFPSQVVQPVNPFQLPSKRTRQWTKSSLLPPFNPPPSSWMPSRVTIPREASWLNFVISKPNNHNRNFHTNTNQQNLTITHLLRSAIEIANSRIPHLKNQWRASNLTGIIIYHQGWSMSRKPTRLITMGNNSLIVGVITAGERCTRRLDQGSWRLSRLGSRLLTGLIISPTHRKISTECSKPSKPWVD